MSDTTVSVAGGDARQSMIKVWMAISAVWVAFWLLIALIVLATFGAGYSYAEELRPFYLIVLAPPLALLALGAIGRWTFSAFAHVVAGLSFTR